MIRIEDLGVVDGMMVQAVYMDQTLIGYNYSEPPADEEPAS